jgi:hypothetical protein
MLSAGISIHLDGADGTRADGRVSEAEYRAAEDAIRSEFDSGATSVTINGIEVNEDNWQDWLLQLRAAYVSESAEAQPPTQAQIDGAVKVVEDLYQEALRAQEVLRQAEAEGDPAKIAEAQAKLSQLQEALKTQIRHLEYLNKANGKSADTGIRSEIYTMAGTRPDGMGGAKATITTTSGGSGTGTSTSAMTAGGSGTGFMPPASWGAQVAMPTFTTDAYMQSMMMEDNILSSFDSVLQSQNKGKNLMMLFFYFARMAESGDLGAMYQFMKFLTYIISKDKSKQQIDMGKKLIELQDLSRQWTDKLLGMSTDSTDANASNEFMKVMTQVKSETDAIATSQKLISQMMEEFAQIVETLTNATKGALEANGRVQRTVSQMRG